MATRILPSNPQKKDDATLEILAQMGEAGVSLPKMREKVASTEVSKKTASVEKVAITKEQQASYWQKYFEEAGLSRDYTDWLEILFE